MLFSVVVPVYNCKDFLAECLTSIENQDFENYEIVIIDDGSEDGSQHICDFFCEDQRNARAIHQKNAGPMQARRRGLSEARGDYIIFVDADDCLRKDALKKLAAVIEAFHPDIVSFESSCYSNFAPCEWADYLSGGFYGSDEYDLVKSKVLQGRFNSLWGKAIRKTCFDLNESYREFSGLMHGEDLLQLLPIVDSGESLYHINEALYFYRRNESSSTMRFRREQLESLEIVSKRVSDYGAMWGMDDEASRCILMQYCNLAKMIAHFCQSKNRREELSRLGDSLRNLPDSFVSAASKLRPDNRVIIRSLINNNYNLVYVTILIVDVVKNARNLLSSGSER